MPAALKIGLGLPFMREGRPTTYAEIRGVAKQAEAGGLDSVWYPDHFFLSRGADQIVGLQECWTTMTGLAEATSRVRIGSLVLCQAFRSPGLLAKMAATLQEVAEGRFILGLGAGWYQAEYQQFGYPFNYRASRFEEYVRIVTGLLSNEPTTVTGRFHQTDNARLLPPAPHVPVWIASLNQKMNGMTAAYGEGWNGAWYGIDPAPFAKRIGALKETVKAAGRDVDSIEYSVGILAIPVAQTNQIADVLGQIRSTVPALAALDDAALQKRVAVATPEQLAESLRGFAEAGAKTAIVSVAATPFGHSTDEAQTLFIEKVGKLVG